MEYTAPLHTVGWERPVTNCFNFSTWWKNSIGLISKTSETCFKILSANSGMTRKACWGWRILSITKWYWSCCAMSSLPSSLLLVTCDCLTASPLHQTSPIYLHLWNWHYRVCCPLLHALVVTGGLRWGSTGCGGGRLLLPVKWISNGAWCIRMQRYRQQRWHNVGRWVAAQTVKWVQYQYLIR